MLVTQRHYDVDNLFTPKVPPSRVNTAYHNPSGHTGIMRSTHGIVPNCTSKDFGIGLGPRDQEESHFWPQCFVRQIQVLGNNFLQSPRHFGHKHLFKCFMDSVGTVLNGPTTNRGCTVLHDVGLSFGFNLRISWSPCCIILAACNQ